MKCWTRRQFIEAAAAGVAASPLIASGMTSTAKSDPRPIVYWTPEISEAALIRMVNLVKGELTGKIALKLHTGEPKGPNILPPAWIKTLQGTIPESTIVECNVLYKSPRQTTAGHRKVLEENGWTFSKVDIMDEFGDAPLPIKGGLHLKEIMVGKHFFDYDSLLVLTHFKGHGMGGFGGSLKNIAIGCASAEHGKKQVHNVQPDGSWPRGAGFMEHMADVGKGIVDHFGRKIAFVNVLRNMSIDCDCAGVAASTPTLPDLGIFASTDLVAIDQASIDLVYSLPDWVKHTFVKRVESREGLRQLSAMKEIGVGTGEYRIVRVLDKKPGQRPLEDGTDEA